MKKKILSVMGTAAAVLCLAVGNAPAFSGAAETEYIYTDEDEILLAFDESEEYFLSLPDSPEILSNFGEDSYIYGDFLDSNNKAVYDAVKEWVTPSEEVLSIKMPQAITVSLSALPNSSDYSEEDAEALSTAVFESCKSGIDSALYDYPEIYWLDVGKILINFSNVTYSYSPRTRTYNFKIGTLLITPGTFDGFEDIDEAASMKETFEKAIEDFPVSGDTRYEQLKSIHDQIAEFTNYDINGKYASSAMGALVEAGVVCEGYSKAFKLICDRLGIPCVLVFGNYNEENRTAHMWNYVMMEDGNWYAVDVTWDDLDGSGGKELKYDYFLKGTKSFFTNHTEENNYAMTTFTYPQLCEEDYIFQQETLNGDYNSDGKVNVTDLVICQNSLLGKEIEMFCDYNGDEEFNSLDILAMRMYLVSALDA